MTTAAPEAAQRPAAQGDEPRPADVLVVFGITGDLAKVMTFRSLYRLERRGLLDCPIVGVAVDDWTLDQLRERAKTSIEKTGEQLDPTIFDRLVKRFSYVDGDFSDAGTYEQVAKAIDGAQQPVFYLEIPPFLFGRVVQGLHDAGLTENARVVAGPQRGQLRRNRASGCRLERGQPSGGLSCSRSREDRREHRRNRQPVDSHIDLLSLYLLAICALSSAMRFCASGRNSLLSNSCTSLS